MSEAPETIWISNPVTFSDGSIAPGTFTTSPDWCFKHKYRRADLPPTTAQIMADPRVTALVGLVERASKIIDPCYPEKHKVWQADARAALAQLKETKL